MTQSTPHSILMIVGCLGLFLWSASILPTQSISSQPSSEAPFHSAPTVFKQETLSHSEIEAVLVSSSLSHSLDDQVMQQLINQVELFISDAYFMNDYLMTYTGMQPSPSSPTVTYRDMLEQLKDEFGTNLAAPDLIYPLYDNQTLLAYLQLDLKTSLATQSTTVTLRILDKDHSISPALGEIAPPYAH